MTQFEAFEDGVEVDGQAFRSMLADVGGLSNVFEKQTREPMGETVHRSGYLGNYVFGAATDFTWSMKYKNQCINIIGDETATIGQFDPERTLVGTEAERAERDQWRIEDGNEYVYRIA